MHSRRTPHERHDAHVVCVNSSRELLEMICLLLTDEGYRATPLPVSDDAVEEIRRLSPDAVILDLISTDELSWQLIERINSDPATTRIPSIIVSTDHHALEQIRHESDRYGGDHLLPKPFDVFELCDCLQALLNTSSEHGSHAIDSD